MKSAQPDQFLRAALFYAEKLNWPVFPLRPRSKEPITPHGFKDASRDPNIIKAWWTKWPWANVATPTGIDTWVLDKDMPEGEDSIAALVFKHGRLADTLQQTTGGGGEQYFYQFSDQMHMPSATAVWPGIDIKGEGGYVVLPPSIHPETGKEYVWDTAKKSILEEPINPAPDWLIAEIANAVNGTKPAVEPLELPPKLKASDKQRHPTLKRLAASMSARGNSYQEIVEALWATNVNRCEPPYDRKHIENLARYYALKDAQRNGPPPEDPASNEFAGTLVTRRLSEIQARPVSWLWPQRIPRGKLTIFAGHPGLGKSQISASLAAIISTGGQWPVDRTFAERASVIFLTAEDDAEDTLRPRLEAAGADLTCVHLIESVVVGYTGEGAQQKRVFSLERDIPALDKKLTELGDVAAVIIDPISAYLGDVDSHVNAEVRGLLMPLRDLAAQHITAIIGVSHLNKAAATEALLRVSGSLAFVAAARASYLVTSDPADKMRRLLLPLKCNLAPEMAGLAYRIEGATVESPKGPVETSRVMWDADPVTMSADEAMQAATPQRGGSALNEARDWLKDTLAGGPLSAKEVSAAAEEAGISARTLRRAREVLGVVLKKDGPNGSWRWRLPTTGDRLIIMGGKDAQYPQDDEDEP